MVEATSARVGQKGNRPIESDSREPPWTGTFDRLPNQEWRTNMQDKPIEPMSAENVAVFDVWIFDSQDLVVSIIPLHAPLNATTENYEIKQH